MKVLLIKSLPEPPNNSFNKSFSVGQVFNAFVNDKDNGTAFDIDIKDDPSDFFPIYHNETTCFKELP